MSAIIVSGFPGVGKSYLKNVYSKEKNLIVLDSDSSHFSWKEPGIRNEDFPNNYIQHIKDNMETADIILVSSHQVVREALKESNIKYLLVYPNLNMKDIYIKRYINRNSPTKFIEMIDRDWEDFVNSCIKDTYPIHIVLEEDIYLKDILDIDKWKQYLIEQNNI